MRSVQQSSMTVIPLPPTPPPPPHPPTPPSIYPLYVCVYICICLKAREHSRERMKLFATKFNDGFIPPLHRAPISSGYAFGLSPLALPGKKPKPCFHHPKARKRRKRRGFRVSAKRGAADTRNTDSTDAKATSSVGSAVKTDAIGMSVLRVYATSEPKKTSRPYLSRLIKSSITTRKVSDNCGFRCLPLNFWAATL